MQNGSKTIMTTRQPRPATSYAARSKRWTSSPARPELIGPQNARRNYERYLALARAEVPNWQHGRGRELLPVRRTLFQIDVLGFRKSVRFPLLRWPLRSG